MGLSIGVAVVAFGYIAFQVPLCPGISLKLLETPSPGGSIFCAVFYHNIDDPSPALRHNSIFPDGFKHIKNKTGAIGKRAGPEPFHCRGIGIDMMDTAIMIEPGLPFFQDPRPDMLPLQIPFRECYFRITDNSKGSGGYKPDEGQQFYKV